MHKLATYEITQREKEVLDLLAHYHNYIEICNILGIRYKTVKRHVENIMAKTGIHRKDLLIKYAIEHGYGQMQLTA